MTHTLRNRSVKRGPTLISTTHRHQHLSKPYMIASTNRKNSQTIPWIQPQLQTQSPTHSCQRHS
ncbi:hypothetical protein E3Q13_04016, partial [Wallemia mellicola]